ncbi:TniQ family protein [Pseudomonas umsongensis]|uniref:TniQ family protein n=1 Tax=Pseudomonas umsongensis TaxID=198618 RepID=UPI003D7FA4F9
MNHPFEDETFSSWLYRLAVYNKLPKLGVGALNDLFLYSVSEGSFDADFDSGCTFSAFCRELSLCSLELYDYFFRPMSRWVIPKFFRRSYCYECFCDQIPQSGHPAMLRKWAVTYHTVCLRHQTLLYDADYGVGKNLAVGSKLFSFHNEVLHGRESFRISREEYDAAFSVQCLLIQSEMYNVSSETLNPNIFFAFCRFFIEIMLYPDFGFCSRLHLRARSVQSDLLFWKRLRLGPYLASIQQRHSAILLLGWVLGVIDSDKTMLNIDHAGTFFDLGRASNVIESSGVNRLLFTFSRHLQQRGIKDFISGFCSKNDCARG